MRCRSFSRAEKELPIMNSALSGSSPYDCLSPLAVPLPVPRGLCWFSGTYEDFPGFLKNFYFARQSTFPTQIPAIANSSREVSILPCLMPHFVSGRGDLTRIHAVKLALPHLRQKTYVDCIAFGSIDSDPIVSQFFALYRLFEIFYKSKN